VRFDKKVARGAAGLMYKSEKAAAAANLGGGGTGGQCGAGRRRRAHRALNPPAAEGEGATTGKINEATRTKKEKG